jgi:uncharacterized protein YjbJ (UPF0337 family)
LPARLAGDPLVERRHTRERDMAVDDSARNKTRNAAQKVKGQFKEAAGRVTGDERLEAEGRADKTKASLKQAGEKLKDAFRGR